MILTKPRSSIENAALTIRRDGVILISKNKFLSVVAHGEVILIKWVPPRYARDIMPK